MTRDDRRAQCIEAIGRGYFDNVSARDKANTLRFDDFKRKGVSANGEIIAGSVYARIIANATAAFDALPTVGVRVLSDDWLIGAGAVGFEQADLTNPPEENP